MSTSSTVDVTLVQWGERLFYPPNRIVRAPTTPRLETLMRRRAAVIRPRVVATVTRRAPQAMVKVTGGGRGMAAIAAHFRYISKNGQLEIDEQACCTRHRLKGALRRAMAPLTRCRAERGDMFDQALMLEMSD